MDPYPNLTHWKHYRITTNQRDLGELICNRKYRAAYRKGMPFLTAAKLAIRHTTGHRTLFAWHDATTNQALMLIDMRPFKTNDFEVTVRLADSTVNPYEIIMNKLLPILEAP